MQKNSLRCILAALALALSACSVLQSEPPDETKGWSAARLYSEAREEASIGNYEKAVSHYEKLESRYPFGTYAQQAQMEIAYTYYKQEDQPQALAAVDRFIKLHPNHPNVDYMYYLRGLINFNDKLGLFDFVARQDISERDPKALRDAFDAFKQLVERFPNSQYAADASDRLKYLVNALAQHEVHVADYYYRRGAYLAAANRAQSVIEEFRDAPAIEQALYILVRSYDALGMTQLRDDAQRVFQQNFPNSEYPRGGPKAKQPWWKLW
jgi:outer membrane protein assembly factor BamD